MIKNWYNLKSLCICTTLAFDLIYGFSFFIICWWIRIHLTWSSAGPFSYHTAVYTLSVHLNQTTVCYIHETIVTIKLSVDNRINLWVTSQIFEVRDQCDNFFFFLSSREKMRFYPIVQIISTSVFFNNFLCLHWLAVFT